VILRTPLDIPEVFVTVGPRQNIILVSYTRYIANNFTNLNFFAKVLVSPIILAGSIDIDIGDYICFSQYS